MPAIVALVAANFPAPERPRAYGLVASAGAIAVAAGPLIGGAVTTTGPGGWSSPARSSIVRVILLLTRRMPGRAAEAGARLDVVGHRAVGGRPRAGGVRRAALRRVGLGAAEAGRARRRSGSRRPSGWCSPAWWCCGSSSGGSNRRVARGEEPLVDAAMLRNRQLAGGLTMFFFQFLLQAGLFFTIPLFLSVALGLSAVETGVRLLPLSVTLLLAAVGIPKLWPHASPRRVVRSGSGGAARRHRVADRRARGRRRRRRSSPCRCCSPGWASARWPRSSAR